LKRIYSLTFADLLAWAYLHRGRGCANEKYPGVYSRISYFYSWIVETACDVSAEAPDYFRCGEVSESEPPTVAHTAISHPPTAAQSHSTSPSEHPSSAPSFSEMDSVEFIDWNPKGLPLQHCEGDCDRDSDCAGTMICMQRRTSGSMAVPGCAMPKPVSSIADFCVYPSDVPVS
jgi:hypothetical protein